jgi:RNA polymerase sigma factor (sigma-70 family)
MTTDLQHTPAQHLNETFLEHRAQLRRTALAVVGSAEAADDVLHDAYLKLHEAETGPIRQPLGYCVRVVRNMALDHRRRTTFEGRLLTQEEEGMHVPAPQGSPEQLTIARQQLSIVSEVLGRLPLRTRQAFEMYRLNGLTQRDIGQRMGVSAALVNAMVKDAIGALMACRPLLAIEGV